MTKGAALPAAEDHVNMFLAIRSGDIGALHKLLTRHPGLAAAPLGGAAAGRTALHVATDWPGYFPNGPGIARMLIDAGADVDAREEDGTGETPLHWTASSDDADVARVLIDAGADLEAPGGSIGTPLDNAVGYGCWNVARLLVERGAGVDKLWHASALGLLDRLEELLRDPANRTEAAIDQAFWHACAAGYRRAAALLHEHGASLAFTPAYGRGTVLDAASGHGTQRSNVMKWLEQLGVQRTSDDRS
jgi:ankyrin repeat protein